MTAYSGHWLFTVGHSTFPKRKNSQRWENSWQQASLPWPAVVQPRPDHLTPQCPHTDELSLTSPAFLWNTLHFPEPSAETLLMRTTSHHLVAKRGTCFWFFPQIYRREDPVSSTRRFGTVTMLAQTQTEPPLHHSPRKPPFPRVLKVLYITNKIPLPIPLRLSHPWYPCSPRPPPTTGMPPEKRIGVTCLWLFSISSTFPIIPLGFFPRTISNLKLPHPYACISRIFIQSNSCNQIFPLSPHSLFLEHVSLSLWHEAQPQKHTQKQTQHPFHCVGAQSLPSQSDMEVINMSPRPAKARLVCATVSQQSIQQACTCLGNM